MPQKKRNENWCPICYKFCGYNIHKHSCYAMADQAGRKKINDRNFRMRSDFYRHIFIDPASYSFPQLDVFSREQVINLLTDLGHRVVPARCYLNAPYKLSTALVAPILASSATKPDADSSTVDAPPSGGFPSVAVGATPSGCPSSASVGSRPPSAALGAPPLGGPPSVAAGAPPSVGPSGSAPSVSSSVSTPSGSGSSAAAQGATPLGDTLSFTVGAPPSVGPSGGAPSVSISVTTPSGSSAAAVGAPPLVVLLVIRDALTSGSGSAPSVSTSVSAPSGSSAAVVGTPPLGDTLSVTVGAPPSDIH